MPLIESIISSKCNDSIILNVDIESNTSLYSVDKRPPLVNANMICTIHVFIVPTNLIIYRQHMNWRDQRMINFDNEPSESDVTVTGKDETSWAKEGPCSSPELV